MTPGRRPARARSAVGVSSRRHSHDTGVPEPRVSLSESLFQRATPPALVASFMASLTTTPPDHPGGPPSTSPELCGHRGVANPRRHVLELPPEGRHVTGHPAHLFVGPDAGEGKAPGQVHALARTWPYRASSPAKRAVRGAVYSVSCSNRAWSWRLPSPSCPLLLPPRVSSAFARTGCPRSAKGGRPGLSPRRSP